LEILLTESQKRLTNDFQIILLKCFLLIGLFMSFINNSIELLFAQCKSLKPNFPSVK
jgi:hypothetical protein